MEFDLDAYDYTLPQERIAQSPATPRDAARLLLLSPPAAPEHYTFRDLPELLPEGCVLILNNTRVRPARAKGVKESGGALELMWVPEPRLEGTDRGRFLTRGRLRRPGTRLHVGQTCLVFVQRDQDTTAILRTLDGSPIAEVLKDHAQIPLPPYIERPQGPTEEDRERYQTIFAEQPGAVAAPTAGLHFTQETLNQLTSRGIEVGQITLHVGPGTFLPVRCQDVRDHRVLAEPTSIPETTCALLQTAKETGRPIIAVGTTVVRSLEGAAIRALDDPGAPLLRSGSSLEDLVILPGHTFRVVDGMITNFHLPKSSLLLLVSALVGREALLASYEEAVQKQYRFYSYGDAMYIPPRSQP
jgi:S-adenosylmethionine:tRNA ribosyltransferase-isomerase